MSLLPFYGLRARLTAGVALVVVVAVAVTFVVVYRDTGSQLSAAIDRDIQGDATQLAHAILERPTDSPAAVLAAARRYAAAQPYGNQSALLFVVIPGIGTASNHPELFGRARPDDGETGADQASENAEGRSLATPRVGLSTQPAPDIGDLRVFQTKLEVGGRAVYAGAAEPLSAVSHAQATVARSFIEAGAIALALAIVAAYLIGARLSAPLRRMASVAAQVDAGDLGPRLHPSRGSNRELDVLAEAFNHMLDRLAKAFAAQREFVADASHELRTPLTVMRGQLDVLTADDLASPEDLDRVEQLLLGEISRISRLVDDLLLLAQSDHHDFLHLTDVRLDRLLEELWDGLSLIAQRNFEVGPLPELVVRADPDRLAQALRNLARNAITHTRAPDGLVRIDLEQPCPNLARLVVSDDGPGVPSGASERLFERFYRTDPARTRAAGGAGLGLSIVRAIAEAHGGSARLVPSAVGARFEIDLPAAPTRASPRMPRSSAGAGLNSDG